MSDMSNISKSCDICRDLLPLYAEDLCSGASRALVDEHLKDCPDCRAALQGIREPVPDAPDAALPLRTLSRKIKRSTLRITAMVAAALLFIGTVVLYHATWRRYEPYREGLASASLTEDGRLMIVSSCPASMDVRIYPGADGEPPFAYVTFYNVQDKEGETRQYFTVPRGETPNVYYTYPNEEAVLLLKGKNADTGFFTLPRLALNFWWMLAAVAAAALAMLLIVFLRRPKARRILAPALALPLCYLLAHFAIKGMDGTSWDTLRDFLYIVIACAFAWVAAVLALSALREAKAAQ